MHAVIRQYSSATPLSDALSQHEDDVRQLLSSIPGFVAYYAVRDGDRLATITVCQDQAGTDESVRRAANWVTEHLPGASVGAPEVSQGDVILHFKS